MFFSLLMYKKSVFFKLSYEDIVYIRYSSFKPMFNQTKNENVWEMGLNILTRIFINPSQP